MSKEAGRWEGLLEGSGDRIGDRCVQIAGPDPTPGPAGIDLDPSMACVTL